MSPHTRDQLGKRPEFVVRNKTIARSTIWKNIFDTWRGLEAVVTTGAQETQLESNEASQSSESISKDAWFKLINP